MVRTALIDVSVTDSWDVMSSRAPADVHLALLEITARNVCITGVFLLVSAIIQATQPSIPLGLVNENQRRLGIWLILFMDKRMGGR